MGHLSERDLNALIDHRLAGEPLWRAQQHLESCERCRDAFADLSGRQEALERALDHDPGEKYFAGFADRVVDRIVAEEATGADFSPLRDMALRDPIRVSWWQRPQAIAAAGSLVALIAGAGVVLMLAPQRPMPGTAKEREAALRALSATSVAESQAVAPPETGAQQNGALQEADQAQKQEAPAPPATPPAEAPPAAALNERAQPSSRMVPVRRDQTGEEVAAPAMPSPVFAPPPAPENKGTSVLDLKRRAAEPAQLNAAAPPADKEKLAKTAAPSAAQSAAPQAYSSQSRDEAPAARKSAEPAGERRVCGTVRDDTGRALRGVSVTAADIGRTATSDAVGRFCLYLPAGPHTLQLLAVGFKPVWLQVPASAPGAAGSGGELSAMMLAVSVLDGGATAAGRAAAGNVAEKSSEGAKSQASGPVQFDDRSFFSLSDSTQTWIRTAEHLQTVAVSGGTANTWDSAALAWERLLPATEGTAAESEIRSRLAECRFHAWELGPTDKREDQAISSLTSYLVRAPAGPKRDQAAKLLDRIRNH